MRRWLVCSVLLLLAVPAVQAQELDPRLPVVDTHIHYNRDSWSVYSPADALGLIEQAGIRRVLVSSTPDDGTLMLYNAAPDRVVPILRPYRTSNDFLTWTTDPTVLDHVMERLNSGVPYRGIGELQLEPGQANHPVPLALAQLAAERGLWLHVHSGATAIRQVASLRTDVPVLWAHAGVIESPEVVSDVLDQFPNVWMEVSLRHAEIAPSGRLDPRWAALFERHPTRIMIGSDTWINGQWAALPRIQSDVQIWLRQLPPDVAERIAYQNAEALFPAPN
jgi:hypothetical protein